MADEKTLKHIATALERLADQLRGAPKMKRSDLSKRKHVSSHPDPLFVKCLVLAHQQIAPGVDLMDGDSSDERGALYSKIVQRAGEIRVQFLAYLEKGEEGTDGD